MYGIGVAPIGSIITLIQDFIKIGNLVQTYKTDKHIHRHTRRQIDDLISLLYLFKKGKAIS
jgi:hypothetical protein